MSIVCGHNHQGSQHNVYIHLYPYHARHDYGKIQNPTDVFCPAIYMIHFCQIFSNISCIENSEYINSIATTRLNLGKFRINK